MKTANLLNKKYYERSYSYTMSEEYSFVLMRSYKEKFV